MVSLGLDTFAGDPISTFKLQGDDFSRLGSRLQALGLPTAFILEGGYAAAELGDSEHSAEWKVNNAIGGWVKALAGMVTVKKGVRTDNGLTKTYTRLGYAGQGE